MYESNATEEERAEAALLGVILFQFNSVGSKKYRNKWAVLTERFAHTTHTTHLTAREALDAYIDAHSRGEVA